MLFPDSPRSGKEALLAKFNEIFWPNYPRKVNKVQALKAWMQLKPTEKIIQAILKDLPRFRTRDKEYIPHASTYLRNRRWEDEEVPSITYSTHTPSRAPVEERRRLAREKEEEWMEMPQELKDQISNLFK